MAHGVHPQLHLQFGIGSPGVLTHCIILISCYNITMIMINRSAKWNQLVTYSEPVGALNRRPFLLAKKDGEQNVHRRPCLLVKNSFPTAFPQFQFSMLFNHE